MGVEKKSSEELEKKKTKQNGLDMDRVQEERVILPIRG